MVSFAVPGRPIPQGSLSSFRHRTTGQIVTPQKARVREYRDRIAWAARAANVACTGGPVVISCTFAFARPKSHYTANGELGRRDRPADRHPHRRHPCPPGQPDRVLVGGR